MCEKTDRPTEARRRYRLQSWTRRCQEAYFGKTGIRVGVVPASSDGIGDRGLDRTAPQQVQTPVGIVGGGVVQSIMAAAGFGAALRGGGDQGGDREHVLDLPACHRA